MVEVAPGIERIESVFGPRPFARYLLRGERSMFVDTGIISTPGDVFLPFFEQGVHAPTSLNCVLTSHADVDHFGGNASLLKAAPQAIFCASAHYDVIEGGEVFDFLDVSAGFVMRARGATRRAIQKRDQATLAGPLEELGPELGPFTSFPNELCGPIRSHLGELVAQGVVEPVRGAQLPAWRWIG